MPLTSDYEIIKGNKEERSIHLLMKSIEYPTVNTKKNVIQL